MSVLVGNPEDMFSCVAAHMILFSGHLIKFQSYMHLFSYSIYYMFAYEVNYLGTLVSDL